MDDRRRSTPGSTREPRRADGDNAREHVRAAPRPRAGDDRAGRTSDGRAAGMAHRFPSRLAAGPLRRAPRLHEVHGAHEPGVYRRAVLDRVAELVAETARRVRIGAAGVGWPMCPSAAYTDVRVSDGTRPVCAGAHGRTDLRRLQPEMHASVVRRAAARRREPDPLPLPRGTLRPRDRPSDRGPAASSAVAGASRDCAAASIFAAGVEERTV